MNRGEIWGKWIVRQYLGGGGMGEVYLAMNLENSANVAVKRVRRTPGLEGEEKIAAERMGAELEQKLSAIDSRVTKVFWFGEVDGDLAIEMEYVEGEDLATRLARGPIDPGRAAVIAAELCEMLHHLRGLNVIHGDLKPKNIRIDPREQIKVMDFGVAKALSLSRDHTASLFGSIAYCSPERLDTGSMDARSDLWSVGVMLYQMVAGSLPFTGETAEKLERSIRGGASIPPLPTVCPEALRRVVAKLLARDLSQRYASEVEARQDLERFLRGEPVMAAVASDATVRTERSVDATVRTFRAPRPPANIPWRWVLAAGLAVIAFVFWLVHPEYVAWADTRELKHKIEAEQINTDQAWKKYEEIVERKPLGLVTWTVSGALKARLVAAGDRPILDFRNNDYPTAREPQWRAAAVNFSRALAVDPGDATVKAKLRICEGQLQRINASGVSRQQMLNEAAAKFQEAAALWKSSPDPYLALERLYAYSDPDRAQSAADQAHKLGHTDTRREMAQLADGYYRRAALAVRDAEKVRGLILTEREYLFRARQDYQRARALYSQLGSFGNSSDTLVQSVHALDNVQARLQEMDGMKE